MADNWAAVGNAITDRMDEIGMQQLQLSAAARVSTSIIRAIQRGKAARRNPRVLQDISAALGWPDNPLQAILQGEEPDLKSHETRAAEGLDEETARVVEGTESAVEETEGADEEAVGTSEGQSVFLTKFAAVLEHRIGSVVDVIYNNDSDIDITIKITHATRER